MDGSGMPGNLGDMGGLQEMMQQALAAQEELTKLEVSGTAGGGKVSATVNGARELQALTIDPEVVDPQDTETLADLVVAAIRDANTNAEQAMSEKLGPLAGGLGGQGGPGGGLGLPGM